MKLRPLHALLLACGLVIPGTAAVLARIPDPVSLPGTFVTGDNRRQRLGHLRYEETAHLIAILEVQARGEEPGHELEAIVRLAQIYRSRRMPREAAEWLQRGLQLAPGNPSIERERELLLKMVRER